MTAVLESPTLPEQVEGFAMRLLESVVAMMDLATIKLGRDLGLYAHLAEGPLTFPELAARAGTDERYTREWVEQQSVTGIVVCQDPQEDAVSRKYVLPPAHAMVLADRSSPAFLAAVVDMIGPVGAVLPRLAAAFRSGEGVDWASYGDDARTAQAELNRPGYLHRLAQEWFPALPDIETRMRAGARVADLGCGAGWSSIAMALAYPDVTIDGIDADDASIADARRNAEEAGVADRVRFEVADASSPGLPTSSYDVVLAFETIHDMADPVGALAAMRRLAAPEAAVLVVESPVSESFAAAGGPLDRLLYGSSVLVCLPTGRAASESAATGAAMTPDVFEDYARRAGFSSVSIADVPDPMWRFYRLQQG